MLRDEVEEFSRLSGEDGWHTSISRVGAYLDGYNKAKQDAHVQIVVHCPECHNCGHDTVFHQMWCGLLGRMVKQSDYCSFAERKEG